MRPVFREALERVLPHTNAPDKNDPDYEDFRLLFLAAVFQPDAAEQARWSEAIVSHRWYLKLQRRRFGHSASAAERNAVRQMVRDAQEKLATRLAKNPTLGLTPERYKELPGFIKNHCRSIAGSLMKQKARRHLQTAAAQLAPCTYVNTQHQAISGG